MMNAIYDHCVPVFLRYLSNLSALVKNAGLYCEQHARPEEFIMFASLSPDMHPFLSNVQIAGDFALRTCASLANVAKPEYGAAETSLDGLVQRIAKTSAFLSELAPEQFEGAAGRIIATQAGEKHLSLKGDEFLSLYALPNFFFHVSIAYANLRALGLDIGKADFDGFHRYSKELREPQNVVPEPVVR